jgi:hypothetical protein
LLPEGPADALTKQGRIDVDGLDLVDRIAHGPMLYVSDHLSSNFRNMKGRSREAPKDRLRRIPPSQSVLDCLR